MLDNNIKHNELLSNAYIIAKDFDNAVNSLINVTKLSDDAKYDISLFEGSVPVERFYNITGDSEITAVLCTPNETQWNDLRVEVKSKENELANFKMKLEIKWVNYKVKKDNTDEDLSLIHI